MFYIPHFSLHHQYELSEFLGFCKTPKNVGYIVRACGGSLNTFVTQNGKNISRKP